jgi:hypothetical protein
VSDRVFEQALACRSDNVAIDGRWPRSGPTAHELTAVVSMLSHPLFLEEDDSLGAPNLYATRPAAFSEDNMTALGRPF